MLIIIFFRKQSLIRTKGDVALLDSSLSSSPRVDVYDGGGAEKRDISNGIMAALSHVPTCSPGIQLLWPRARSEQRRTPVNTFPRHSRPFECIVVLGRRECRKPADFKIDRSIVYEFHLRKGRAKKSRRDRIARCLNWQTLRGQPRPMHRRYRCFVVQLKKSNAYQKHQARYQVRTSDGYRSRPISNPVRHIRKQNRVPGTSEVIRHYRHVGADLNSNHGNP